MRNTAVPFTSRQRLNAADYEVFYYYDIPKTDVAPHVHSHYEIYFFIEGRVDYNISGEVHELKSGDVLIITPGVEHYPCYIDKNKPYKRFVLWLEPEFLDRLAIFIYDIKFSTDYSSIHKRYLYHLEYIQFNNVLNSMFDIWQEHNEERMFKTTTVVNNIVTVMLKLNRVVYDDINGVHDSRVSLHILIRQYINDNITKPLTLESVANRFFVSKHYVSHMFKENLGIPLHHYIIKRRLSISRTAIMAGENVTTVAQKLGFNDYTSFYRDFKKEYGISPKAFQKEMVLADNKGE
jgi:AraC-like DNA-binding protein